MVRSIKIGVGLLTLSCLMLGCSRSISQTPPANAAIESMREHFMYAEVTDWLKADLARSSLRSMLQSRGFKFDGTERQGGQEVDGYSLSAGAGVSNVPRVGLTALHAPGTERVVGINVIALSPAGQTEGKKLVEFSLDSVDASAAGAGSGQLHFLGAERLGPRKLLKIMLRVDRLRNEVFSVMYVVSAE